MLAFGWGWTVRLFGGWMRIRAVVVGIPLAGALLICLRGLPAIEAGSPPVLPGNILIADAGNNRIIEVTPDKRVVWEFPRPGDLAPGESFYYPDDAFYTPGGHTIITN